MPRPEATTCTQVSDLIDHANRLRLDSDKFGELLAIMWECWNARNIFIFKNSDKNLHVLGKKAIEFVHSFRAHHEPICFIDSSSHPTAWSPPIAGCLKLNFDRGLVGDSFWGWGFVLRTQDGHVLLADAKHGRNPATATTEEARSCLYSLCYAYEFGARNIIVEGHNLSLIYMLQAKSTYDNTVGLFICSILSFIEKFAFFS
ncbi:hypothetical protein Cgig2_003216 [Carnegiea gigantea]|uniref:RNase H type-1 domain-containing protein n=1 Tax=Carnegiea gigantea TaxID=171969 RepID=A0A9Q1K507_9CARY|nr:hypothetical protein Cgig2_003216 [Carnegiea gigantea]